MTTPEDLTTDEGVNEGSADATTESALDRRDTDNDGGGGTGTLGAASEDGAPEDGYDPSPPVEMVLPGSSTSARTAPGQQLEAGEG